MWYWKQCSYNTFVLTGPLGTQKWFDSYQALYDFCQSTGIDAKQA